MRLKAIHADLRRLEREFESQKTLTSIYRLWRCFFFGYCKERMGQLVDEITLESVTEWFQCFGVPTRYLANHFRRFVQTKNFALAKTGSGL